MTTENNENGVAVGQTDNDVETRTAEDVYYEYVQGHGQEACDLALNEFWDTTAIVEMLLHRLSASEMDQYLNDMLGEPQSSPEESNGPSQQPELSPDEQAFLRELEEWRDDSRPVDHSPEAVGMTVRQRLLSHVAENLTESAIHTASEALTDLLLEAPEITVELLEPLFDWTDYWPQRIAAELLGLPTDHEYECEELVREFDRREAMRRRPRGTNWKSEGF